jgi:hypothetical protein
MVRKNLQKQIDETIRMELEDVPQQHVKNWCNHIEIHQENVSLVGQMVGLPIGAKRIGCRFHHGYSGMTMGQTAAIFIEANCFDCPNHTVVNPDNFGEALIAKIRDRKKTRNEVEKATQLLKGLTPPNPTEALKSDVESDTTARELAGLLTTEEHKREAADKLLQGTKFKPKIISGSLASVLIGAVLDPQVGSIVMEILRLAGLHDIDILLIAVKGAIVALNEGRNVDSASMLITEAVKQKQISFTPEIVSTLVSWLPAPIDPFPHLGIRRDKKGREGVEEAFKTFTTQDKRLVEETILNLLRSDQPHLVAAACAAVQILNESSPDFSVERYFKPLLEALSREREDEDMYVDASICQTLAQMMKREPLVVSKEIFAAINKATEELQESLFHIFIRNEALAVAEAWIEPFVSLLANAKIADQTKFELSELLSHISRDRPDVVIAHITGLFGVLAIVSGLEDDKRKLAQEPGKERISFFEYQSCISALSGAARNLREVIENVGNTDAEKTVSEIRELIARTSSKSAASFKTELILLLGDFGHRNPDLCSKIIPLIFPHLVDSDSYMVRGAAAEAYREIAMRDGSCLPENVTILLAALLGDEYLYPVRVAVEAFEWIEVKDFQLAGKVVNRLVTTYAAYKQDQSQGHLLEKVSAALVNIADTHTPFLPCAAQIAIDLGNHPYYYSAKDGLRSLRRLIRRHKEYEPFYLSLLINYYSRFDLEITSSRAGYHSGKSDSEFEELYDLSPEVIKSETTKLTTVAQSQKEPNNLIHFACLLINVGAIKEAADLFRKYTTLLPDEERYAWTRSKYNALAFLLEAETALVGRDLNEAKKLIEEALEIAGSIERPKRNLPFGLERAIPREDEKPDFYTTWLQIRQRWLNLNNDPVELDKATEEVIQQIESLNTRTTDQMALYIHKELAVAARFLAQWYQCVLNGDLGQDAKRGAIKAHLAEILRGVQGHGHELLEARVEDHLSKVDSLSTTKGIRELLQDLLRGAISSLHSCIADMFFLKIAFNDTRLLLAAS